MNEAQTKHDLIEPALRKAGWGVVAKNIFYQGLL